jgi:hypothetical protein
MTGRKLLGWALLMSLVAFSFGAETVYAQSSKPVLEPKAVELLKAASNRLAAAHTMSFTAVVTEESPSRLAIPLAYTTKSDGPTSEFDYDDKIMMAYSPAEDLVAIADAPPTIDETVEVAYHAAAIYFPFDDVIASDPYKDLAEDLLGITPEQNVEGTLVVDLYDAKSQSLVWRGIGQNTLNKNGNKNQQMVEKAIQKMFKQWPGV